MALNLCTYVHIRSFISCLVRTHSFWAPRATTKSKTITGIDDRGLDTLIPPSTCTELQLLKTVNAPPVLRRPREILAASLPGFNRKSCQFVVFDLETTGLKTDSEICQIAALRICSQVKELWTTYMLPAGSIDPGASLVTGLVVNYAGNERYLTRHGKCVKALLYGEGIGAFYKYLKKLSSDARHTVLVGFCSKWFDVPLLCKALRQQGVTGESLDQLGIHFADSFPILKRNIFVSSSTVSSPKGATLSHMYETLFDKSFQAHDAVNDVKALTRILLHSPFNNISLDSLLTQAVTAGSSFAAMEFSETKARLLNTMQNRLFSENSGLSCKWPITKYMAGKIAASGLGYRDLQRVYEEWGGVGITKVCKSIVMSESGKKCYRVTNNDNIISAIVRHFEEQGN